MDNSSAALGIFAVGIVISGFGTGTFKATIAPLLADQVENRKIYVEERKGERVLVDPNITIARLYSLFYFMINVGSLAGQLGCAYAERYVGFWLSFALPTWCLLICPVILWVGRNRYVKRPPEGSVVPQAFRAWKYAMAPHWTWNPIQLKRNTLDNPEFWQRSIPSNVPVEERATWMTWSDSWIPELRRGVIACKIYLAFPFYFIVYQQINNNLVSQSAVMQLGGVPNDVIQNLDPLALLILIPLHEFVFYPALRRMRINLTPVRKIALGFQIAALAMLAAALIQWQMYKQSPCGYYAATCDDPAPFSVWVQTPAWVLVAESEILASIIGLEYGATKAPMNLRSTIFAIFYLQQAIAAAINEALIALTEDPLLIYLYGTLGVLACLAGIVFFFATRNIDRQEIALNQLDIGTSHFGQGSATGIEDNIHRHADDLVRRRPHKEELDSEVKTAPAHLAPRLVDHSV